jgi:hypothetical protein
LATSAAAIRAVDVIQNLYEILTGRRDAVLGNAVAAVMLDVAALLQPLQGVAQGVRVQGLPGGDGEVTQNVGVTAWTLF